VNEEATIAYESEKMMLDINDPFTWFVDLVERL
jgi:hypothetical protein